MNLIQIQSGCKQFGSKLLFNQAQFSINAGEHVGVIGPNGAGKTTLFKILVDQEQLDSGVLTKSQSLRVGYLEQESDWSLEQPAEGYLKENCTKGIWELKQIGRSLGLSNEHFCQPLQKLSGGYRMRMKLLYLIGLEPNLMLLDEPTNFLDLESVLALERFLQDYQGAFLLISHDREFLRRTTEMTLEVENGEITKFPGNIDDYFEEKVQLQQTLQAQALNLEAKRKHIQDFVDKFKAKATKARQAQSRMKQLQKMETIEIKRLPVSAKIHIPPPRHTGKEALSLINADLGYSEKTILKNINLRFERGDHLGVVGFNGAGKSTLLKSLAGILPVKAGSLKYGYEVSYAHFTQHSTESLQPEDTVLDSLQHAAHHQITAQEILNLAGSLLFSGDSVHKKVKVLSGGEKSRVALGQVLLKKAPLLFLDEPTNHLDFETVEALTEALHSYVGSLVVVSHDRGFISRVATKILEIRDGKVELYPGTYDEYVWSLEKGVLSQGASHTSEEIQNSQQEPPAQEEKVNFKTERKKIESEIKNLQRHLKSRESELEKMEQNRTQINQDLLSSKGIKAGELAKKLGHCSQEIEVLENGILQQMEALEGLTQQLMKLTQHK